MHKERYFFVKHTKLPRRITHTCNALQTLRKIIQRVVQRNLLVYILKPTSFCKGLPLGNIVSKRFYKVRAELLDVISARNDTFDCVLAHCLLNIYLDWDPIDFLHFFSFNRFFTHGVFINASNEKQSHYLVLNGFNLNILLLVDVVIQQQSSLLPNLSDCALHLVLPLVNLTFWEVKFTDGALPRIVVNDEKEFVQCCIVD